MFEIFDMENAMDAVDLELVLIVQIPNVIVTPRGPSSRCKSKRGCLAKNLIDQGYEVTTFGGPSKAMAKLKQDGEEVEELEDYLLEEKNLWERELKKSPRLEEELHLAQDQLQQDRDYLTQARD
uniref:Uncharacterized protein n=1 Tax=Cannabis sativa TaxID=3483 RepID=A0A803PIC7_CANSA